MRKNRSENECEHELRRRGFRVTKRGWPDFIAYKGDKVVIVEVKRQARVKLKPAQREVMRVLARAGLHVYRWTPDGEIGGTFEKFKD